MLKAVAAIRTIILLLAGTLTVQAFATDITVTMSGASPYCGSAIITLNYDGTGNTFHEGNIFVAQLSSESGNFGTPAIIGTLASVSATGSIQVTFPSGASGTAFRVRIVATKPSLTGLDNGLNFTIIPKPAPSITIAGDPSTTVGAGSAIYFSTTISDAGTAPAVEWKKNGLPAGTGTAFVLEPASDADQIVAVVTSDAACAHPPQASSNTIDVNVDENLTPSNHGWEERARQPNGPGGYFERSNASGFTIGANGKLYVGCGSTPTETYRKDFWEYDPSTDVWTQKADLDGVGRYNAVGFSVGAKGYIGLGRSATGVKNDLYEYEPSGNNWVVRKPFPGAAREQAFAFGINGTNTRGYVGGGNATGDFDDFYEFNPPGNSWLLKAPFPGGKRLGAAAFSMAGKGFVAAGYSSTSNTWFKDFWEYDQQSGIWTQRASMPGSVRSRATAFALGGNGYVGLGYSSTGYQGQFYQYILSSNSWNQKSNYPGPTTLTAGVGLSLDGRAFIYKDGRMIEFNPFTTAAFASKVCTGESIAIDYDASGVVFTTLNQFKVAISSTPNFSISTTLKTHSSTNPTGTINVVIPTGPNGTYYFKITTNNPPITTLLETIAITGVPTSHTITPVDGTTVCKDVPVTFNSTLDETDGFQWYKNDVPVGTDNYTYVDGDLDDGDVIKCVRIYSEGCKDPVELTSDDLDMIVNSPGTPAVVVQQPNTLVSSQAIQYQWFLNDEAIPAATGQSYKMTESGVYKVRVADGGGCYAFSDELFDAFTGLEDQWFKFDVMAYPSPFKNDMFLSVADHIVAQGCDFSMLNELGQTIIDKQPAQKVNKLDMSGKTPGVYILKVSFGTNTIVRRVVKVY